MQSVFRDGDTEQAIVDFICQQPVLYKEYLVLAQRYHCCHQLGDKEGCQTLGLEIARSILPFAQEYDSRLLCLVPREIVDQYEVEYEEGAESERILNYHFVGEASSSDGDEDEAGEEE